MNITPLGNKLLVERIEVRHRGPIAIPESADLEFNIDTAGHYRVISVGPKVVDVQAGDRIVCYSHTVGAVAFDDTKRRIITADQVLMRLREDK